MHVITLLLIEWEFILIINCTCYSVTYMREFHNKVPPDKMPLLCRKFCVINKPFTENIVYFCLNDICLPEKMIYGMHIHMKFSS